MFGKSKKREAVAFVDYEHWFYGYSNRFQMRPNVDEWLKELKNEFHMKDIFFFGDFSEPNIGKDLERLKKITSGIVHTASEKIGVDKDFTDVIILDQIYRYASKKKSPDVYILFTGDAHFLKVAEYLKELGEKSYYLRREVCVQQSFKIHSDKLCRDATAVTGKRSL